MNILWPIIFIILSAWFWRDSRGSFVNGRNDWGWVYLVISAINFASAMVFIL